MTSLEDTVFVLSFLPFSQFSLRLRQRMQSKLEQQVVSKGAASNGSPGVLCVVTDALPADALLFASRVAEFLVDKVSKWLCVVCGCEVCCADLCYRTVFGVIFVAACCVCEVHQAHYPGGGRSTMQDCLLPFRRQLTGCYGHVLIALLGGMWRRINER